MNTQVESAFLATEIYVEHSNGKHDHAEEKGISIHSDTKVNLKEMFPVSARYPVRNCVTGIALCILLGAFLYRLEGPEGFFHPSSPLGYIAVGVMGVMILTTFSRYLYEEAHRRALQYETDGFRLIITRGILFKKEVSLPLLPITEMYVDRDVLDLLMGLYDLNIATPVTGSRAYGLIHGLNSKNAHGIESFLSAQLNRQIFTVDNPPPMN